MLQAYNTWKTLGSVAFELLDLEFANASEADEFTMKLMTIEKFQSEINSQAVQRKEAEIQRETHRPRRGEQK